MASASNNIPNHKSTEGAPSIGTLPFLDYVLASPRKAVLIAKEQKVRYLSTTSHAFLTYKPLLAGMRRAVNTPDPRAELDKVAAWALLKQDWRGPAYRTAANGFLDLLPRQATGVRVIEPIWIEGDLTVVGRDLIGLRLPNETLQLVLPYVKEPELDQETADIVLYLMESVIEQALPEATPTLWDTRRGKAFKLSSRTNRRYLDASTRGLAAKYLREWSLAA